MILKEADDRSRDIAELQRLKQTADEKLHARIDKQIRNVRTGAKGESDAAYFLKGEYGASEGVIVINDLRLEIDGDFVQIDHLVLHRFQGAAWVLESKNWSGRMTCDEHGDWTVWYGKKPKSVPSPVSQARRQCTMLRRWFDQHGIETIRKIDPVVLISPTSSVNRTYLPPDTHVVKSDNFATWWQEQADQIGFAKALGMVGRHLIQGMSHEEFIRVGERLVQAHQPLRTNWRAKLNLPQDGTRAVRATDPVPVVKCRTDAAGKRDDARVISTPYGNVTIKPIGDKRFALRNDRNDELIEIVKASCKGKARWNPRFANWLIEEDQLPSVLSSLMMAQSQRLQSGSG